MSQRTALITGVAGGIGRATAEAFHDAGWEIIGTDIRDPEGDALGEFISCDLSSAPEILALFDTLREGCNRLDTLVNNAAYQICKPLAETSVDDWDQVHAVNLRAPFLCMREALGLLEPASGSVVNVSSVHAIATSRDISAYATSKGGLTALTRAAALEFAEHGVRVNAVLPGAVDTDMLSDGLTRDHAEGDGLQSRFEAFSRRHPLDRVAKPEEVAQAILFLADSDRSAYITGESLVVDGGVTARLSTE